MTGELPIRRRGKAYGYVVSDRRLLVFREPEFPEVRIQVPGGTLEPGETPEVGAVRELTEELGRSDFALGEPVGTQTFAFDKDGTRHIHDRHYFRIAPLGAWPERWTHADETPDLGGPPVRMEFFWMRLEDPALSLFAGHDALLPQLKRLLGGGP